MTSKIAQLQALLYVAGDGGIKKEQLRDLLQLADPEIESLAKRLQEKLASDLDCGLQLLEINDEYKLTTSGEVSDLVEAYFNKDLTKNISQSALEILAIVAYRQPITRIEIDEIRGSTLLVPCRPWFGGAWSRPRGLRTPRATPSCT